MPRPNSVTLAVGDRVGIRTVVAGPELRLGARGGARRTMVLMACECGDQTWVVLLRAATMESCGCVSRTQHGYQRHWRQNGQHPLYTAWAAMKQRCSNPKNPAYRLYGARGIGYCEEWEDAATFLAWAEAAGWEPGLQIDRIDNDGDYEPDNCRFVTPKVNSNNRRSHGKTLAIPKGS